MVYGAITALRMGLSPAVVTSAGPDVCTSADLSGIRVHNVASARTTTFRNRYHRGKRTQIVESAAGPIGIDDVPVQWRAAPLVLLGPLIGEVEDELARAFPNATVLSSLQGWLRRWDEEGRVGAVRWDGADVLPHVDAAVVSAEDIVAPGQIDRWKDLVPVLLVTEGRHGAWLHFEGAWRRIDAYPVAQIDPTGAGDVFGAAFLIRYSETRDPSESARFASCAASFCVEAEGTDGIPTRAQVEVRLGLGTCRVERLRKDAS